MKSVGEVLRKAREDQHLTIDEVFAHTRIDPRYVDAIERNAFGELPTAVSTLGFVSTYAAFVGQDPAAMIALCRRDFHIGEQETVVPRLVAERKRRRQRFFRAVAGALVITFFVVGGYTVWFRYLRVQTPALAILEPTELALVKSPVVVRGRTASDAVVQIDAQPVAVTQDGEFATQVELGSGEHVITITAKSRDGATSTRQVMVTVEE